MGYLDLSGTYWLFDETKSAHLGFQGMVKEEWGGRVGAGGQR